MISKHIHQRNTMTKETVTWPASRHSFQQCRRRSLWGRPARWTASRREGYPPGPAWWWEGGTVQSPCPAAASEPQTPFGPLPLSRPGPLPSPPLSLENTVIKSVSQRFVPQGRVSVKYHLNFVFYHLLHCHWKTQLSSPVLQTFIPQARLNIKHHLKKQKKYLPSSVMSRSSSIHCYWKTRTYLQSSAAVSVRCMPEGWEGSKYHPHYFYQVQDPFPPSLPLPP